ncbi:MAG TPA: PEP/pyruvate-binding domain-containing protein [Candidatus Limnocylindria bacterium]
MTRMAETPPATIVRRLRDVRLADAPEVGGKAASLGELIGVGYRVPDGVVLTVRAAETSSVEWASILESVAGLGSGPFAVRSSGVSEDGVDHSYAGIYESVLDVAAEDLPVATDRVVASARGPRPAGYAAGDNGLGRIAVIVQQMVQPAAAGVALTADPVNGDRMVSIVTAVRGTGERLVSGEALGDEWAIRKGSATPRRHPENAINAAQAVQVAEVARRIAADRGTPQDVEWAIDVAGTLWILQARPMTALPADVSWESPAPGAFTRTLRFGEWIGEPVTPLFESWLLSTLEVRLHACLKAEIGQRAPLPHHVLVNGWYFYSINWISPANMLRSAPSILARVLGDPRRAAGVIPPLVRFAYPVFEREWRDELGPRYRSAVVEAENRVDAIPVEELPPFLDGLADRAGEYSFSLVALAGAAYKAEMNLARFYRRHLAPILGGSHLPLLAGLGTPSASGTAALLSLDWWHAPTAVEPMGVDPDVHARVVRERVDLERAALDVLAGSARRTRAFRGLLDHAQHLVPIREAQVAEWTLPWPVMRRAVLRIGERLAQRGVIGAADDVFFLSRTEAVAALRGSEALVDTASRRATREAQAKLVPPLMVGRPHPAIRRLWEGYPAMLGAVRSEHALVAGTPASGGRATGSVRVVRGPDDFGTLQPGEILVAPMTAPAWTPLFRTAAAVVTDVGSPAAHASIIAREYGIPAVVGCGDATARLRDGMRVTVDGGTGNVELA